MGNTLGARTSLPPQQQAIRTKLFHPSGSFMKFKQEEVEQLIPDRFEQIVCRYPERIAIKTKNHVLTYAELNAMANRLAHTILAEQGNEAEPVGLVFEKGAAQMAAMLGVLKAGKFFVLLDPSFPRARITAVLEDSQARLVITDRRNVSLAGEVADGGCRLKDFESVDSSISAEDLKLGLSPRAFTSIVYTSGSTGQPKGVVWDHRVLLHRIMLRTNSNHICEHDRISFLSSGTTNAVTNTFLALLNGAALFPFDVRKEGVIRLAGWLLQEKITICPISSPLFRNLCETLTGEESFPDLRIIRLRSDTVYKTDVDLYKKYFSPDCTFMSGLSSGEGGQLTTYLINHNTEITGNEVPVGYAGEDKEILLLDDRGKEVGFNEVGEIAVRSRYLFNGYWRRPDLTKAKFIADPRGGYEVVYLTGDLGLMLPDGCLMHKGRKDFRVKIRGYGVEFAEVEKALLEHAAVKEAVVMARQNQPGEARLVAYFTSIGQPGPSVSELRGFLKKSLPDYMIPSTFVMMDAIPLTPSGKVDRRALPDQKNSRPELDAPFVAPRTSKEKELAKIWAEVLGLDQIGIHDNFFDLGGHSLLATRVISRIRDALRVEIPLIHFFEAPTVNALADYIEKARPLQDGAEALSIQPVSRDGQLHLSFAQQRLWFLEQLKPGSAAYNIFSAARLAGRLSVGALEQSFNEITKRHEALRTVFKAVDGEPSQVILPSMTIKVPVVDLGEIVSDAQRESEVRRLTASQVHQPFDLAHGPLLRATLLRLTEDEHRLLLTVHQMVFDGWSRGILAKELSVLYEAFSSGHPSSLPALPIQYADFTQWQRKWLQGSVLEAQLAYWKEQLEDVPTLQLPTDRLRPSVQTARGARQYFALSNALTAELKSLSKRNGVTLFMTLVAAYQAMLHRYTGQTDVMIASPISGRNRSELENLVGCFLNVLVLRTDLSGNPTFRELLARVREVCLRAYANQDLPFEKLVEELRLERNSGQNPLIQTTFSFRNTPRSPLELAGSVASDLEVYPGVARSDLHLFLEEKEGELQGRVNYSTDLFNTATIARMVGHFQTLLKGIVAEPDEQIANLPLLAKGERHQLLVEWNATEESYPAEKCIHELFEEQVERSPEAVAVVFGDERLTYRMLNRRANRLAHYLRSRGVGPEVLVGVYLERSAEMVIALLGILKAGGAYVPLDPSYPKARLDYILKDAQVSLLLIQRRLLELLPSYSGEVVCIDEDTRRFEREEETNPDSITGPDNLAYVTYTSGSTGKPKGVLSRHRGAVNYLAYLGHTYGLERADAVLQIPSLSFDASVRDIMGPLAEGMRIVLVDETTAKEPVALLSKIEQERVTCLLSIVPTMLSALSEAASKKDVRYDSIRLILVAGEALPLCVCRRAQDVFGQRTLVVNQYGPTECTMTSSYYPVKTSQSNEGIALIGRPIPNSKIYILDSFLNPVSIGVYGEIHIGGVGVTRGYLNEPELTAEKFIPDPCSNEPGARLYRAGDRARYLSDGHIEFRGRVDDQVKIHGIRIELGEIEAVVGQHPGVRDVVVVANGDELGDPSAPLSTGKRLVAYVVPALESVLSSSVLREFLKGRLPGYMVPSAFVFLDELPLTPNGKVDRKALPDPDKRRPDSEENYVEPRTPVEEVVAGIWAEVLGVERVCIHDNFFEHGGHSLKAAQLVARVGQIFGVEVPLRSFFERPTVAEISSALGSVGLEVSTLNEVARTWLQVGQLSTEEIRELTSGDRESVG